MRLPAEGVEEAQRGAVGGGREHRARGEVDADPDDLTRVDRGTGDQATDGLAEGLEVVVRVLEGPVGTEDHVAVGIRQAGVDDAVGVRMDLDAVDAPVRHVDEDRARRLGPEVDADGIAGVDDLGHRRSPAGTPDVGLTTTFRPRRDASVSNAAGAASSG